MESFTISKMHQRGGNCMVRNRQQRRANACFTPSARGLRRIKAGLEALSDLREKPAGTIRIWPLRVEIAPQVRVEGGKVGNRGRAAAQLCRQLPDIVEKVV